MKNTKTKAIAYVRVANQKQLNQHILLSSQYEKIKDYADKNNIEIVAVFDCVGSKHNLQRIAEMLICCRRSKDVELLLVSRFDRISRNLADYYRYKNAFEGHGVSIKSVTETIGDSHSGEFMEALYVLTAQLDSHHRSERVKAGSRRKTEKA